MPEPQIIVRKKKPKHGAPHGGAWKVAYADFVTAMMALFIVLWLMSASKQVQDAVGGYFRDPIGSSKMSGSNKSGTADSNPVIKKEQDMQKLKQQIVEAIHRLDPLDKLKRQIEITLTPEGLRIELMESSKGTFFELGSAQPTPALKELLQVLSAELGKLPNNISIEGHTDSKPYALKGSYDNWDLSTNRANEARRLMEAAGVRYDQISQVRGFASQRPRLPLHPEDPSNRRVTVIVQYQVMNGSEISSPALDRLRAEKDGYGKMPAPSAPVEKNEPGPAKSISENDSAPKAGTSKGSTGAAGSSKTAAATSAAKAAAGSAAKPSATVALRSSGVAGAGQ